MGIPSNLLPLYISPMDDDCGLLNFVPSKTDDLHFTPQTSFVPCRANLYHFQLYFVFAIFYMLSACSFHRYLPPAAFRQLSALALMPSNMKSARSMACGWSLHLKCLFFLCPLSIYLFLPFIVLPFP